MFKYSEETQTIKVYDFSAITGELIGQSDAMIAPNTGLPARCTDIKPPRSKAGCVAVFVDGAWSSVVDLRGKVFYSTDTGYPTTVTELGPLPENATSLAPATRFDRWNGKAWVKDNAAEQVQLVQDADALKKELMGRAMLQIDTLQDAVNLEMASKEESDQLAAWRKYRVLLNRVDTSAAPKVTWPEVIG